MSLTATGSQIAWHDPGAAEEEKCCCGDELCYVPQWAFSTSVGLSSCPSDCTDLASIWNALSPSRRLTGWGTKLSCGVYTAGVDFIPGTDKFWVNNTSTDTSKKKRIYITCGSKFTIGVGSFYLTDSDGVGHTIPATVQAYSICFDIPAKCPTPFDLTGYFYAEFGPCTCSSSTSCRNGWVAQPPTCALVDASLSLSPCA